MPDPVAIARLQTPPGLGGIAVIELSGPEAPSLLGKVFHPWPSHRRGGPGLLQLGWLADRTRRIDQAVVHQGAERIEINIHGGSQAARAVMKALAACGARIEPAAPAATDHARLAHPKWDNPAIGAEMLQALPSAVSTLVASALTHQWSGGISELAHSLQEAFEAPEDSTPEPAIARCVVAAEALSVMTRLLTSPEVVLAGPVNAGKSSLANALVGRPVSVVHDQPGTTRDWVRERALLAGVPIWLTDTAGLWSQQEGIDAEAIRRGRRRARQADLVVLLCAGKPIDRPEWLREQPLLVISGKCDIHGATGGRDLAVSAVTGQGLEELRRAMRTALALDEIDPTAAMAFTERQAALLHCAAEAMRSGEQARAARALHELLAGGENAVQ